MSRCFVIPDVHGCSKTLAKLYGDLLKPDASDTLVFLGDYVNKGPDTRGVIDFLINLQGIHQNLFFLRGNHDQLLLDSMATGFTGPEYFEKSLATTLNNFNVDHPSKIPDRYIDFLRSTIFYFIYEPYLMIHAGLNFAIPNPMDDTEAMLYLREMEPVPSMIDHRIIIHGHIPKKLEEVEAQLRERNSAAYGIDTGCVYPEKGMGHLLALELTQWQWFVSPNIDMQG